MKHNIYLLKSYGPNGQTLYKIGYSSSIEQRLYFYKGHNPFIEVVKTWYLPNAKEFEKGLHRLAESVSGNEWYGESDKDYLVSLIEAGELPDDALATASFSQALKECVSSSTTADRREELVKCYPDIATIIECVPRRRLSTLAYRKALLLDEIERRSERWRSTLREELRPFFKKGELYFTVDVKEVIREVYKKYELFKDEVPKTTLITQLFPKAKHISHYHQGVVYRVLLFDE